MLTGGGYAEYAVTPAAQCLPFPGGLDAIQAGSLPETFFTVWFDVFDLGGLKAGETLLVHGGSSGIGVTAIQLAKALGSRVFVTAGSEEKCAACRKLGADLAINYREVDFEKEVHNVDVILDMVGGSYTLKNLRVLARCGRLVYINFMESSKAEIDLSLIMGRQLTITGSGLRPQTVERKADIAHDLEERVWPLIFERQDSPCHRQRLSARKRRGSASPHGIQPAHRQDHAASKLKNPGQYTQFPISSHRDRGNRELSILSRVFVSALCVLPSAPPCRFDRLRVPRANARSAYAPRPGEPLPPPDAGRLRTDARKCRGWPRCGPTHGR